MSDEPEWASRERQIELLLDGISYFPNPTSVDADVPLPAACRKPFAERLYEKGFRVHPPLATVETTVVGDPRMGSYAQAQTRSKARNDEVSMELLRQRNPDLADRIENATDEEREQLRAELEPSARQALQLMLATQKP